MTLKKTTPYILLMRPMWVPKVWGGRGLATHLGKALPDDGQSYGESWEVADLPEGQSTILNGPWAGAPLRDVVEAWGVDLYGDKHHCGRFPLLVKFLDARDDLSVQVHPGPQHVDAQRGIHSKDESWLIVHSDEGSIYHGFDHNVANDAVDAQVLEKSIKAGTCVRLLRCYDVRSGDVVRIEPGTIHAILSGVMLLEIQQPSDTTYRVYDYDRPGLDGQMRQLHVKEAMGVLRFGAQPQAFQTPVVLNDQNGVVHERLVAAPQYTIDRVLVYASTWKLPEASVARVLVVLGGELTILHGNERYPLSAGQTCILPAALDEIFIQGSGGFCLAW